MTKREEALAIISYTLGYCNRSLYDIESITAEDVWEEWYEECERFGISPYTQLPV